LLDVLQSRKAVATFFVLGSQASAHGGILRRAVELRNEVANHSWGHPNLTRLDNAAIAWQVDQTSQAISNATGVYPKLFRPPEGAFDSRVIAHVGLPLALWSIDTNDWRDRNADSLYQQVVANARPGAVVLMHDIHAPAVEAAPRLIDELQRQGYVLVTMSELFGVNKDNLGQFSGQVLRSR
jgi:peptidoglycan/xylan/chitin deacetylase (PgdA/CDA1 family)